MSVVVLCRLGFLDDSARQKVFEAARLAVPFSGTDLLFAGDETSGAGEPLRSTFAIRFRKIDQAHQFIDTLREADFGTSTPLDAESQLITPWPATIGQVPLMLFP